MFLFFQSFVCFTARILGTQMNPKVASQYAHVYMLNFIGYLKMNTDKALVPVTK